MMHKAPAAKTCGIYLDILRADQNVPRPTDARMSEPPQQSEATNPVTTPPAAGAVLTRFIPVFSQLVTTVRPAWRYRIVPVSDTLDTQSSNTIQSRPQFLPPARNM